MSSLAPAMRHVRGFDVARPLSIGMLVFMMLPLVFLPLASIFIFGTSNGLDKFWAALTAPEAIFALKLSMATSSDPCTTTFLGISSTLREATFPDLKTSPFRTS